MAKNKNSVSNHNLDSLFYPKSVAHVGASANEVIGRFNFSKYLLQMGYKGSIYPVNPKYSDICGLKCYPDLKSIPDGIDLVIMAVPAKNCPLVLKDIPEGKIKFVVIHTSGFGEINRGGLEVELLKLAQEKNFRIVGPNCMGAYSQRGKIGFWWDHYEVIDKPGPAGLISQSGGHAINAIRGGINTGLYFDKGISLGNQIDLSILEVLEYYINDESIGTIGIYVEEVSDGRRFLQLIKSITSKKPVVVWNGGITGPGKSAAATHTGSIAGNSEIFRSAMKQAGALMPADRTEFIQLLRLLQPQYPLPFSNVAVISPGGGNTVNICDTIASMPNLNLPVLKPETQNRLKKLLPEENVDIKNPVDSGGVGMSVLKEMLSIIMSDSQVESILVLIDVDSLAILENDKNREDIVEEISFTLKDSFQKYKKPVHAFPIQHRPNNEQSDKYRRMFINRFISTAVPWLGGSYSNVAGIYSKLVWYRKYLRSAVQKETGRT